MAPSTTRGEGERLRGERRQGMISGQRFKDREVTFTKVGDLAVFQGDIILGRAADLEANLARGTVEPQAVPQGIGITGRRWPDGLVPFEVSPDLPNPGLVRRAIRHWETRTRIRFVELTGANASQYPNWVKFSPGEDCFSPVGVQGECQEVLLKGDCTVGNVIHELGHTLGLWHEQGREDRDEHVDILWENIDPPYVGDFKQKFREYDDVGDYDYGSVMHYWRKAFSKNNKDTIRPKKPRVRIGQRVRLSAGDISAIKSMYPDAWA